MKVLDKTLDSMGVELKKTSYLSTKTTLLGFTLVSGQRRRPDFYRSLCLDSFATERDPRAKINCGFVRDYRYQVPICWVDVGEVQWRVLLLTYVEHLHPLPRASYRIVSLSEINRGLPDE